MKLACNTDVEIINQVEISSVIRFINIHIEF